MNHPRPNPHRGAARATAVLLIALALGLAAAAAHAQSSLGFLGRSTIAHFNERDFDLARGALGRALTSEKMDVAYAWRNPDTRAGGEITPLRAFEHDGKPCRELRIVSFHPKSRSQGVYALCRQNNRWVVFTPRK